MAAVEELPGVVLVRFASSNVMSGGSEIKRNDDEFLPSLAVTLKSSDRPPLAFPPRHHELRQIGLLCLRRLSPPQVELDLVNCLRGIVIPVEAEGRMPASGDTVAAKTDSRIDPPFTGVQATKMPFTYTTAGTAIETPPTGYVADDTRIKRPGQAAHFLHSSLIESFKTFSAARLSVRNVRIQH